MDWEVSDDDLFDSTIEIDDNDVFNTANLAMQDDFAKSSNSVMSAIIEQDTEVLINKSSVIATEVDSSMFDHLNENDFEYEIPKSFHKDLACVACIPLLKGYDDDDMQIDLVLSLECGDLVTLNSGVPFSRCHVGFAAKSIIVHPILVSDKLNLFFVLSNNGELAIVKLIFKELKVVKKYSGILKYDIVPDYCEGAIIHKVIIEFSANSKTEEFNLYNDKKMNEFTRPNDLAVHLNHYLKYHQDLFDEKEKVLKKQIELKKEVFQDLFNEVSYSSLNKSSSSVKKELPVTISDHWLCINNQKFIIGLNVINNKSVHTEEFDLMITDHSSAANSTRYKTVLYSKYIPRKNQIVHDEGFDVFLGPYQVNGTEWCKSNKIMPGENILLTILDPPKLDLVLHKTTLHIVLHYTIDEENLQTAVVDISVNAKQLLGNEFMPQFVNGNLSGQDIFSVLASSRRVIELSIVPSSKEVIQSIIAGLEKEMNFRMVENQSEGWFVCDKNPMMFQYGVLLRLQFLEDDGLSQCLVAARSDEQLLLLMQAFYMNLPCGFAIISERTRIIEKDVEDEDKKLAAEKSLESELLIMKKIMEEHGEKNLENVNKCFIRFDANTEKLLHKLIDQESRTDKLISQIEI